MLWHVVHTEACSATIVTTPFCCGKYGGRELNALQIKKIKLPVRVKHLGNVLQTHRPQPNTERCCKYIQHKRNANTEKDNGTVNRGHYSAEHRLMYHPSFLCYGLTSH